VSVRVCVSVCERERVRNTVLIMFPSKYNEHHMLSTGFPIGFSVFLWELMPIDSVDHSDCVIGQCTVQYLCALLNRCCSETLPWSSYTT